MSVPLSLPKFPSWFAEAFAHLEQQVANERLPHALLIDGPGGWGEPLLASALACLLLGLERESIARDIAHPDLRWIEPEDGTIKIDQIRALSAFIAQTPRHGDRKVAIVDEAHHMNANSANALLKTLEEPPDGSYLVLVTDSLHQLIPTIRSRCQRVQLATPSPQAVSAWLTEQGVDHPHLDMLMVEYGNAPYRVMDAVERDEQPLWLALTGVRAGTLTAIDAADDLRKENLVDVTGRWLRHVHRMAQSGAAPVELLKLGDELTALRAAALSNTGLNKRIQLERLFLRWRDLPS
ncbi:MAG: hypothetical protein O7H39_15955 [Gammaproteobacteria bacterium]|nr:hypothetical protein [Gammaproteobacteria bacterium]